MDESPNASRFFAPEYERVEFMPSVTTLFFDNIKASQPYLRNKDNLALCSPY